MDARSRYRALGYTLAVLGLLFAGWALAFPKEQLPWPLFVGSFVYLMGAFLVLIFSRGAEGKANMGRLRFIRLGFVAVFALVVWRMLAP